MNPKRNIFNIVNDEMRSSATALAEEIRATRNKSNLQRVDAIEIGENSALHHPHHRKSKRSRIETKATQMREEVNTQISGWITTNK